MLHTIVSDPDNPKKLWVGISAAGIFATEDGGATWERRNRLSNAEACVHHDHPAAPRDGDIGLCVHNMVRAPGTSDVFYQQNHHGVWRSADGGRSWDDLTKGLPSTFGFPICVHPRDPNTIWTLPLNGDMAGRPGMTAERQSPFVHRLGLREETRQDVIDHHVVLLLKAGMRNAGHHGELLVRVRQLLEKLQQIFH